MYASFRIICADADMLRIENCLQNILSENVQHETMPYWKITGCTEITCVYSHIHMDMEKLQEVVRQISGKDNLIISQQVDYVEYSAYTTTEEILSSDACAFVVCFVNKKEDTK